jgi:methylthioribose-1-phosphate isomerase
MYSPLLFPVRLEERKLLVLDETSLPFKEEYLKVEKLEDALDILAKMKTRALGQVLLFFYSAVLFQKKFSPEELAKRFKEIRPTFDFELLGQILNKQAKSGITLEEAVKNFIQGLEQKRKARAKELAKDLPDKANILTICNVSGELVYLFCSKP